MTVHVDDFTKLLRDLSEQHANHGYVDVSLIRKFCASVQESDDTRLDARVIAQLITLQAYVLSDLQKVENHPVVKDRIDECMALNELLRAYLRS